MFIETESCGNIMIDMFKCVRLDYAFAGAKSIFYPYPDINVVYCDTLGSKRRLRRKERVKA